MSSDETILRTVHLKEHHHASGKARHFRHGQLLGRPRVLKIVQYEGDPGFLLIRYDDTEKEMTDTYHESMEAALGQAEWEYGVKRTEWKTTAK